MGYSAKNENRSLADRNHARGPVELGRFGDLRGSPAKEAGQEVGDEGLAFGW
jgi:hypothetical protein